MAEGKKTRVAKLFILPLLFGMNGIIVRAEKRQKVILSLF